MKKKLIQIRVFEDVKQKLKQHAKLEKGITLNALINNMINDYIKKNRL